MTPAAYSAITELVIAVTRPVMAVIIPGSVCQNDLSFFLSSALEFPPPAFVVSTMCSPMFRGQRIPHRACLNQWAGVMPKATKNINCALY